jgi:hypothetical protein
LIKCGTHFKRIIKRCRVRCGQRHILECLNPIIWCSIFVKYSHKLFLSHGRWKIKLTCPNRPFQNEYRKRVPVRLRRATARQVRLHPLSCDFSATSQISVIAQPRAPSHAPRCPYCIRNADW